MAASHPFLRTKKNTHDWCCTTALTVPGTVQVVFTSHLPSGVWNCRGFHPSFPSTWDLGELPGVAELYYWHPASSMGEREKLSANQAAGPHICIWMQKFRHPRENHRLILSTFFNGLYRSPHLVLWRTLNSSRTPWWTPHDSIWQMNTSSAPWWSSKWPYKALTDTFSRRSISWIITVWKSSPWKKQDALPILLPGLWNGFYRHQ